MPDSRHNVLRCSSCGQHSLIRLATEYKCVKCGYSKPRFIKPTTSQPMFLNVNSKGKETKKFLEDVGRPKPEEPMKPIVEERLHWYLTDDGHVFIKRGSKLIDVKTQKEFTEKMAKELEEKWHQ